MDNSANGRPQFSVVIPTCDRPDRLRQCLDRFTPGFQGLSGSGYEVIVTDDSADKIAIQTMLQAHYPWAKWVAGPRRGPAANRNHGAGLAVGSWIVFCDDDCLPDASLLITYANACASQPDGEVFEGRTMADREKRHPLEESPINHQGGNLWSCNFAIKRYLFEKTGGFDESFPHAAVEDMEFRVRLQKAGASIVFLPDALVVHPWRQLTVRGYLKQQARHRNSHLILIQKHSEFLQIFTTWNVLKDIVRHYVRQVPVEVARCGPQALLYEPIFLWCQILRIFTYRFGVKTHALDGNGKALPRRMGATDFRSST